MKYYILDFDSTFITKEALEVLARIVLKSHPQKDEVISQIKEITNLGMEGKIGFEESLSRRVKLLKAHKTDIENLTKVLAQNITPSFLRNKNFFRENSNQIYIISGGFKEFINPIVATFGIDNEHILANKFLYDEQGFVIGANPNNHLSKDGGKIKAVESLNLEGEIIVIRDGFTDFQIKKSGNAHLFFAFTENIKRESVIKEADFVVSSFDEVLSHSS